VKKGAKRGLSKQAVSGVRPDGLSAGRVTPNALSRSRVAPAQEEEFEDPVPGFFVRETPRGITVVTLQFIADQAKRDPRWIEAQRPVYPSDNDFRREFFIDWTASIGSQFYPEYMALGGRDVFVASSPGLMLSLPVYRGWDFGFHHPACVWFQYSPRSHRVWFLRELLPTDIDVYSFADLVLFLSGQLRFEHLGPRAQAEVALIQSEPRLPLYARSVPWFPQLSTPIRYLDFAGHEALMPSDRVENEKAEKTHADILLSKGVVLQAHGVSPNARESVMRRLLRIYADGHPGVIFDPACPLFIDGMHGGFQYKEPTKGDPIPSDMKNDRYYINLHDAAGYALVEAVPTVDPLPVPEGTIFKGRVPVPVAQVMKEKEESAGWYETEKGRDWGSRRGETL
jgi:hypothetical protein